MTRDGDVLLDPDAVTFDFEDFALCTTVLIMHDTKAFKPVKYLVLL